MDPAHLVHRVPVRRRLGELEDHLVAGLGVGELADLEEVVGEREVRLGHVLRVRIVLEQLVVDRARLLHVLAALQRVPVIEERHVHLRVVAERLVVGEALVGLHRLEQVLLGLSRPSFACLAWTSAAASSPCRRDRSSAPSGGTALLLRVELAEAEVVVALLFDFAVGRRVDELGEDRSCSLRMLRPGPRSRAPRRR
jgi:hypothetical protein